MPCLPLPRLEAAAAVPPQDTRHSPEAPPTLCLRFHSCPCAARIPRAEVQCTKTKVCDCPVGSIGDGGSIGGAGRLLLRCRGRAQRAEHPTLHAGRGSVGRGPALSSLYRPSPPRNPSLASVSCREWRVRRAVGGSAAEPSAPSDDTLHLDRPEQLAGFQMAHGIAAPQPGVLHQLQELNPSGTAINPPETAGSRPARVRRASRRRRHPRPDRRPEPLPMIARLVRPWWHLQHPVGDGW